MIVRLFNRIMWGVWMIFYPITVPTTATICYVTFRWIKPELRTDFMDCVALAHGAWSKCAAKYAGAGGMG